MCVINNDNYIERLSPCTFAKETVSNGSLSPVDEVSTPRSPTNQNGHDKFLSLFAADETEPTRSCTSVNSQHRDEIYYKRNSLTRPFKDRHSQNYYKNFNGLGTAGRRSRSLSSVLSPATATSNSKSFDGNSSLDRNQRRRYRTFSNNRRPSKLDFLSSVNRWSTSTPVLHSAQIAISNEREPSSSLFQFRRLSTMRTLGLLGPIIHPKPPNILVYCGRDSVQSMKVFETLRPCVARSVNTVSRYLVYKLEHDRFIDDAPTWAKTVACLILADLKDLDEQHWEKLYDYFRYGGKLLFLCDNGLFVSLRDCNSAKKRFSLLRLAFEGGRHRTSLSSLSPASGFLSSSRANKDFDKFLKKLSTKLDKTNASLFENLKRCY
uniref:Uncharacterized protein n=1 Tax=Romanomermis culicivorax TaxID=13658 RepID=A0A915JX85_ROMCU